MALTHLAAGQPIDIVPLASDLATTPSMALFKTAELEVIRLVLLAGKSMPPHKVAGALTLQCLEGILEVTVDGTPCTLRANQLMYLPGDAMHGLLAHEDASALLTIVLRN